MALRNLLDNFLCSPREFTIGGVDGQRPAGFAGRVIRQGELRKKSSTEKQLSFRPIGEYTIEDILKNWRNRGRDPCAQIEEFRFGRYIKSYRGCKSGYDGTGLVTISPTSVLCGHRVVKQGMGWCIFHS